MASEPRAVGVPAIRKKVVVIGAGVVGVSTAHMLTRVGHDVVIVEERGDVALETSFANAGRFCPSEMLKGPIATPGAPLGIFGALWHRVVKDGSPAPGS